MGRMPRALANSCACNKRSRQPRPRCVVTTWTAPRFVSTSIPIAVLFSRQKNGAVPGQLGGAAKQERIATKIALPTVHSPSHRRMEMAMPAKLLGDPPSPIDAGGTSPVEIELLQRDDSTDNWAITSAMRASERCRSIPTQPCTL